MPLAFEDLKDVLTSEEYAAASKARTFTPKQRCETYAALLLYSFDWAHTPGFYSEHWRKIYTRLEKLR
jgi:hypothetical protein